jgi:hypothetical protein
MEEMQIVDRGSYQHLREQFLKNSVNLSGKCKHTVTDENSAFYALAKQNRQLRSSFPFHLEFVNDILCDLSLILLILSEVNTQVE